MIDAIKEEDSQIKLEKENSGEVERSTGSSNEKDGSRSRSPAHSRKKGDNDSVLILPDNIILEEREILAEKSA